MFDGYFAHPVTQSFITESRDAEDSLTSLICNQEIVSLETFFAHFVAIGHLKGLRAGRVLLKEEYEGLKEELKTKQEQLKRNE